MKNNEKIKIGCLVSYDYRYLEYALPTYYEYADSIAIAIDKDRLTWSGQSFEIPTSFFDWIKSFDIDNKIDIYEDSFYMADLTSMECETRERNLLTDFFGADGWHIQLDLDEYFLNFPEFVRFLHRLDFDKDYSITAEWVTIFKQNENEFFLIDSNEVFPLASNRPKYTLARNISGTDHRKRIHTDFKILHHSWGRSTEELQQKLDSWGHNKDFCTDSYFNLWKAIDRYNYKYLHNFHPLDGTSWKTLECIEASTIPILIEETRRVQEIKKEEILAQKSVFNRLFRKKKK